jgi:ABC-2 type transport system ATP-binding protein
MSIIKALGLTRVFGPVRALDGISFEVPEGIIFGFLGPNGSGKTTTIRLLLGLLSPTAGQVEVLGFNPAMQGDQVRLCCGALLEHTGLYERLSAEDNLDFYGQVWRISPHERRARIQELLTSLDLWERRKEPCGAWSRGMKQKLAIARVLIHRPALIFLDEPSAGLDAVASAALHQSLLALVQREGVTVFLTTHHLAEAEKLCAQVAVIRRGELLMQGTPDELRLRQGGNRLEVIGRGFSPAILNEVRLRPEVAGLAQEGQRLMVDLKGNPDSSTLVGLLVSAGVKVEEVRKGKASLEEAFLEMVNHE